MLRQAIFLIALAVPTLAEASPLPIKQSARPKLPSHRHAPTDLEIVIDSNGTRGTLFLSHEFLSRLHQVTGELQPDENFPELPATGIHFTGVDLEALIKSTGVSSSESAVIATCRDGYTSPFPRRAILEHHPILVLTMDGLPIETWAAKTRQYNAGPYFITYQDFIPSFRVLSHTDRAQRPAEIVKLRILPSAQLDAAITPANISNLPPDSPVAQGFEIARQNCIRCHNSGDTGGTKAHRSWQHLAEIAKTRPDFFAAWTQNPQSLDPKAKMPPNLKYDQATLKALTRYFQTFAPAK